MTAILPHPPSSATLAWHPLGAVAPTALVDARVQLHHAAQLANAAAISLLPARADDSHTALEWHAAHGALVAQPIPAGVRSLRVAVRVADLTLLVLDGDSVAAELALDALGLTTALEWLRSALTRLGADGAAVHMRRHFTIPGDVPDERRPWRLDDGAAIRELSAWFANADALLRAIAATEPAAGQVLCWPHHFDIATLIEEPRGRDAARRTIGIGLAPGDEFYAEPYWYVGPYPRPDVRRLAPLAVGHWHSQGWVGAALTGSTIVTAGASDAQAATVRAFVAGAVSALRDVFVKERGDEATT